MRNYKKKRTMYLNWNFSPILHEIIEYKPFLTACVPTLQMDAIISTVRFV